MRKILSLLLSVSIVCCYVTSCEEAAYALGESGSMKLDQYSLSELNGSEIATFTVTSRSGDTGEKTICPGERDLASIKKEIEKRVEVGNQKVVDKAASLAQRFPGDHSVEQVCEIFEYLKNNWNYTGDPRCGEFYRYANQTIRLGEEIGRAGAGDCDDFAILMAALIENIGGTTKINLVYDEWQGHAYTEVCIGKHNSNDNKVNKTSTWLKKKYDVEKIYAHVDESGFVWLNLDWWADHPGGPFYPVDNHKGFVRVNPHLPIVSLNPPNIPPNPVISWEVEEPNAREPIIFDASQSYDLYGGIADYEWDFGDGVRENGPVVNHTYRKGGPYPVMLKVTDVEGKENRTISSIEVNEPPVAEFSYSIEDKKSGYLITFDASESYDEEDGEVASFTWNFGDGHTTMELSDGLATNFYPRSGTFNVSLTVKDSNRALGVKSIPIKINLPPIAKFSVNNSEPNVGEGIAVDASQSLDADGKITEYRWNFGDGKTARGPQAIHNYLKGGNFIIKLEIIDDNDAVNSTTRDLRVNKPPVAAFSYAPTSPRADGIVTFDADESEDLDGRIVDYLWDFGEGGRKQGFACVDYKYIKGGVYSVVLTVTDDDGAKSSNSKKVTVGEKESSTAEDHRPERGVLAESDKKGLEGWSRTFGGAGQDGGYSVEQTADGGYIIAGRTLDAFGGDDLWLIKTNSAGYRAWDTSFGWEGADWGNSVQQTAEGGYIITGYTQDDLGGKDVWLIKTDSAGNRVWDRTFGGSGQDEGNSVQQTADGGYIIAGYTLDNFGGDDLWLIKTDPDGDLVWERTFGGKGHEQGDSVWQTDDGGYVITGRTLDNFGGDDLWLIKTDPAGDLVWERTFGGEGADWGHSVQQTADEGYIITGYTLDDFGGKDLYLIKTDSFGYSEWERAFGGAGQEEGHSVQQTVDGGYIITGYTLDDFGGDDLWLIKTDSSGYRVWDRTFGGAGQEVGFSVQQTTDEGYIITGYTLDNFGGDDLWLIKTDKNGDLVG